MTADAARRRYRRLLTLAPARLRARHGAEMEEAFLLAWRQARSAGRLAAQLEEARRVPGRGYWLLDGLDAGRADVALFRAWLLRELAQSRARIEDYGISDA